MTAHSLLHLVFHLPQSAARDDCICTVEATVSSTLDHVELLTDIAF